MKRNYLLSFLKSCLLVAFLVLTTSQVKSQTWTPRPGSISAASGGYYEYLPVGYDGSKKFPVIVFLHGIGEQGSGSLSDLAKLATVGLPGVINSGNFPPVFTVGGNNFSFIIICPQFYGWPTSNDVEDVINFAVNKYSVDQSRIYLTGLSMGGGATWDHAGSSPARASRLAALVPVCGASSPNAYGEQTMAAASLPVLATHNNDDPTVTVWNTIGYVDGINSYGANPQAIKVIWPTGGHNAWTMTYDPNTKLTNNMNCYEWMLQYKRGTSTPPPPPSVSVKISSSSNVSCYGSSNGSATAAASSGTAPYTYSWNTSPVQTTATASNLPAGNYTVTVKDANNTTATASVTITQPAKLVLTVSAGTISTNGGTTSVTLSATGGTAPYTFTGPTSNVKAGTYTYTVTDAKGCTDSKSITITEPAPAPAPAPAPSPLTISAISHTDITCNGANNGKATVSVAGGTTPYTYSWSSSPAQTSADATGLAAGNYTVTVKDAANNSVSASVTITEPTVLTLSASAGTINTYGGSTTVSLSASGGTPPYVYSGQTTNVTAGSYTYWVTDANGCKASADVNISQPAQLKVTAKSTGIKCKGNKCSVSLTTEGGLAPYTIQGDTTNLAAGTYTYTVTDAKGAKGSTSITITEPDALVLSPTASTITTIGGTTDVQLNATGGTTPYAFQGETKGVKAGTYNYQVQDANGCTASSSLEVKEPGVKLSAFNLSTVDTVISLRWNTSYEYAIDRYEVEKAKDDKTFFTISRNKSKGNSNSQKEYSQDDAGQIEGSNTYKLYAITQFGQKVYLGEKKLFFNDIGSAVIKNLTDRLEITLVSNREEKVSIMLYDIAGRPVSQTQIYKNNNLLRTTVPMQQLRPGVYVVRVFTQRGMQAVKQVAKQ